MAKRQEEATAAAGGYSFQTGTGPVTQGPMEGDILRGTSSQEAELFQTYPIRWGGRPMDSNAALERLWQMDRAQKEQIQRQLWNSGMYSDTAYYNGKRMPLFGELDPDTFEAFSNALQIARVSGSLENVLSGTAGAQRFAVGGGREQQTLVGIFEQANPAQLRTMLDDIAQARLGRRASAEEKRLLTGLIQEFGVAQQRAAFNVRVGAARADEAAGFTAAQTMTTQGPVNASDLDKFMAAMSGQESGGSYNATNARTGASGKYQVMPNNWPAWSKEAGLGENAARTPENQEIVARFKMSQYLREYDGNWAAVAAAWYGGPKAGERWFKGKLTKADSQKQGKGKEPSIVEYVDSVLSRFKKQGPTALQQPLTGPASAGMPGSPFAGPPAPGATTTPQAAGPPVTLPIGPPPTAIQTATGIVTREAAEAQAEEELVKRNPHEAEMQDWRTMFGSLSQLIGQTRANL